jgi:PhnB protein
MATRLPAGKHALTPNLVVSNGPAALEFYAAAFGAEVLSRFENGGVLMHSDLKVGDSAFTVCDAMPEYGLAAADPAQPVHASFMLYLDDVDSAFARCVELGATPLEEPSLQFHGARAGSIRDPFGHRWNLNTHVEDVSPEELERRVEAFMATAAS